MLILKWLLKVKMTQFTKLYLKLDKEKEHLITFSHSEKYSICTQGVGPGRDCQSGQWSNGGIISTPLFLYFCILTRIGWLASRLETIQTNF